MSLFESIYGLTECGKKAFERNWTKALSEDVFQYIDEEPFQPYITIGRLTDGAYSGEENTILAAKINNNLVTTYLNGKIKIWSCARSN